MNARRPQVAALLALAIAGCRTDAPAPSGSVLPPTTLPAATQATTLAGKLHEILNRHADSGATVSARVVDPETGEELFAQDATRPVIPASNMKLTVTSAALDFFGPDAVFETDLAIVGDDLYLIGHGDPGTGDDQIEAKYQREPTTLIEKWVEELKAKGITQVKGDLRYYDGAFDRKQTHPSWGNDLNEWYAAPVSGLNFNDNCIDAIASPSPIEGQPPSVEVIPETTDTVVVQNRATSATSRPAMRSASTATTTPATTRASGDTIDWSREQTQNVYAITGTVSKVTKLQSKPVTDPGAFFADAVRTLFAKRGITIAGKIVRADAPPTGTMTKLAPAQTRFVDILARINKNSQNMMAEGAAKKLGREFLAMRARVTDPSKLVGSWENADTAVRDFFARNDIDATGLQFVDGSGLSRQNRVTTKLISDILLTMYRKPYFQTFKGSLGISGVEGTTRNRLKDLPNRVFCKTGYIGGVRSLSGYVLTDGGKLRVFSFIYNKIPGGGIGATRPFEDLQDEALRLLMKD